MNTTRYASLITTVSLLAMTTLTCVGCRSSEPAPPRDTREPPIAVKARPDGTIIQVSAANSGR
jgi:hypothetical protein